MADYRKALRSAARAALAADDRIGAYRSFLPWVRAVDPQSMPCYCVVVPGEGQRLSAQDGRDASTRVQVILKRLGSDTLEDDLDDDVSAIDAAIVPALQGVQGAIAVDPQGVEFQYSGEGGQTVGEAVVTYAVERITEMPRGA